MNAVDATTFTPLQCSFRPNDSTNSAIESTRHFSSDLEEFMEEPDSGEMTFSESTEKQSALNLDFTNMTRKELYAASKHLYDTGVLTEEETRRLQMEADIHTVDTSGLFTTVDSLEKFDYVSILTLMIGNQTGFIDSERLKDMDSALMKILEFMGEYGTDDRDSLASIDVQESLTSV